MIKFRLMLDKEKETAWLNELAGQGYALRGFFAGFYSFEACEPGEYVYQIDITPGMFRVDDDYREFMLETGVEIVCLWGMWVILRKRAAEGPFELYTDVESSIEHFEKIRKMFKRVAVIEAMLLVLNLFSTWEGSILGAAGSLLLSLVVVALARQIMRINAVLSELKERIGLDGERRMPGGGRRSSFLMAGFGLNSVGLMMIGLEGSWEILRCFCHGMALGCFGIALAQGFWRRQG